MALFYDKDGFQIETNGTVDGVYISWMGTSYHQGTLGHIRVVDDEIPAIIEALQERLKEKESEDERITADQQPMELADE